MNTHESTRLLDLKDRNFAFVSYLLVSLMMGSAALVLTQLVRRIVPEWQATYLPGFCVFIALERLFTYRLQQGIAVFSRQWMISQIAQWVVMAIIIKLVISLSHGIVSIYPELLSLRDDFYTNFFDVEYIAALVIVILEWWICGRWADLLTEIMVPGSSRNYDYIYYRRGERPNPRQLLIGSIMTLGAVLVVLTGLLRSDLRTILGDQYGSPVSKLPYLAGGGGNVLLYFVLGFALISISKYAELSVEWKASQVIISKNVIAKWALYSILFLVTLSILVGFLPTNYSLDLLSSLGYLFGIVMNIIIFLFGVVVFLSVYLFSFLGSLFRQPVGDFQPPSIPKLSPDQIIISSTPVLWLDVLKSLLFWAILIVVVYFSIRQFLRQHHGVVKLIRQLHGFNFLKSAWHWLIGLFRGLNRQVIKFVDENIQKLIPKETPQFTLGIPRLFNIRALSPREKVIFFFLILIRRAGEGGVPRGVSQTPYEYAEKLQNSLPDVLDDISVMTDSFVEARYSQHDVDDEKANEVKGYWKNIRKALSSSGNEK